jgi:putative Mn2+ efflux pump MntP
MLFLSNHDKDEKVDYLTLILLAIGLSLDDFALAFALSLLMPNETPKKRLISSGKLILAFSISTTLLPLLGWLFGLTIFEFVASYSGWIVLVVFCAVGIWIIKEAFEDEPLKINRNITSIGSLITIGTLSSLDEGAVGISYPFLGLPISSIIVLVIIVNTVFIFTAMQISSRLRKFDRKFPQILSGLILIILGFLNLL